MPINIGYMQTACAKNGGEVMVRIYYDSTIDPELPQPLINGPRGYCLDVSNTTGGNRRVTFTKPDGSGTQDVMVGQGDPVTNRCLTVTQMNNAGFEFRSDIRNFTVAC